MATLRQNVPPATLYWHKPSDGIIDARLRNGGVFFVFISFSSCGVHSDGLDDAKRDYRGSARDSNICDCIPVSQHKRNAYEILRWVFGNDRLWHSIGGPLLLSKELSGHISLPHLLDDK